MFLTAHSAIGIAIATKATNPWLAFILAFIAHYILDAIPHGDEVLFDKMKTKKEKYTKLSMMLIIDFAIIAIYLLLIMTKISLDPVIIFAAVLGSILPDVIWGLYDIKPIKVLKPFVKLHNICHNIFNRKLSLKTGLIVQLLIVILATIYII